MKRSFGGYRSALLLAILLFSFTAVQAQDLDNVVIYGKITDSNDLPIVGAVVTVQMIETGIERNVVTNENGEYRFIQLQPGVYSVKVESPGFGTRERANLRTISAQQLNIDFVLNPADVQAGVTITEDDAPLVDTTRTIVGSTIESRDIEELPNLERNALDLVMILGGISEEALSTNDLADDRNADPRGAPFEQGNFSISGGVSYSNNITIDGLDNNDDRAARDRFQPSIEAVAEVQAVRNQFSAEYGRASGGRINIRMRSGGRRYAGRVFMNYRSDFFNANTWYNNSRGIDRLPMTNFVPGFTYGGPIKLPFYDGSRKTFFFTSYELQQFNDTTQIDTFVPAFSNPLFSLPTPNGTHPNVCDGPNSPLPPCSGTGEIGHYLLQLDTPNTGHIFSARVDHKLTSKNNFNFNFQFGRRTNRRTRGASTTRLEEALQARNIQTEGFNITNNHIFSSNIVNQARFQWTSYRPSFQTDNPGESVILIGYRNPITNGTQTLITGNSSASSNIGFADNRNETRFQIVDTFSYLVGRHSLKFGADVQHVDSKANNLADGTGTFNFNNMFNFSLSNVTRFRQNFGTRTDVTNTYWGVFINDEFRFRNNLTFTLGLRYEQETAVKDHNNFGPRFGVAWGPCRS